MKWFWYSLIGFCILMCSCRTKKLDSNVRIRNQVRSDLSYLNESVKIDTSRTAYFANGTQNIVIEEDIIATEYDKESGKPVKETKTKRKVVQDSDKVVSTEEVKGTSEVNNDSLKHFRDVMKKMDSESESLTKNQGLASVWDKFGEVIGIGTLVVIAYLCWKLKSRVR